MDLSWLPALVSSFGTIIAAFFAYNQYTKNKITDLKVDKWKKDLHTTNVKRNANIAKIYGELWEILHKVNADRVFILQPHPLINSMFISVSFEVKRNGITGTREVIQNFKMADYAESVKRMSTRELIYYPNTETDMSPSRSKAHAILHGTKSSITKRLSDDGDRWIGSLIVCFTKDISINIDQVKKEVYEGAFNIQYVLPEYESPCINKITHEYE